MITRLTWIAGLFVTTLMVLLYAAEPRPLLQARSAIHDSYQRAAPRVPDPAAPIHIVDIDEASLRAFGQWPWPRTDLATLTETLFELGAITVGFDILFAEPDRTSPSAVAENWSDYSGERPEDLGPFVALPDHDEVFAETLAGGATVLALIGASEGAAPAPKAGVAFTGRLPAAALTAFRGALAPIEPLREAASGLGGISLVAGSDGITRSVPMIALYGGTPIPSFSAELLRVAQGAGSHVLRTSEASGEVSGGVVLPVAMRTGALEYPLDSNGHFRIHFAEAQPDRVTSVRTILGPGADPEALRQRIEGKIVLVGSSAQALFDIRSTPLAAEVPGVQLHADILEQIISGHFLVRPDWMRGLEIVLIAAVGMLVTAFAARERPVPGLLAALLSVAALLFGGWLAFTRGGLVLNPFEPALTALAVYLPATTINVFGKERARRRIRESFSHFLPTEIVDEIAEDPEENLTPTGAERELSVIFVDMRGFSTITETMAPEAVVRLLNVYISEVTEALVASGATIDKFMGDAIMAFWNAPLPQADHVERAVMAVFAVEDAVARAGDRLAAEGLPRIQASIGANTGSAFVGLMGSEERLNYSCVGDSVTLAARFEALTRHYGVPNLVGEATAAKAPEGCLAIDIDRVVVKGRSAAATVATLVRADADGKRLAAMIDAMRHAYLRQDWSEARAACVSLAAHESGAMETVRLAEVYLNRIDRLALQAIPSDWDGNFETLMRG